MTAREFLISVTIILTVTGIGALLETAVPMFLAQPQREGRRAFARGVGNELELREPADHL
jgi:hypothetical protein